MSNGDNIPGPLYTLEGSDCSFDLSRRSYLVSLTSFLSGIPMAAPDGITPVIRYQLPGQDYITRHSSRSWLVYGFRLFSVKVQSPALLP